MLAVISTRINNNKFIHNHPKDFIHSENNQLVYYTRIKFVSYIWDNHKVLKLITKLYSNSKLEDKYRGRSAPAKHQVCLFQGTIAISYLNTLWNICNIVYHIYLSDRRSLLEGHPLSRTSALPQDHGKWPFHLPLQILRRSSCS
jgi:hypothetical protein